MESTEQSQSAFIRKWEGQINDLNERELQMLNELVVHKINLIRKARSLMAIAQFNVGEVVSFVADDGIKRVGKVIRINQKTISVQIQGGSYWKVSPRYLKKEE